ncbi:MAG: DUF177 domain-containing protein [Acidobacteriota bacterium]
MIVDLTTLKSSQFSFDFTLTPEEVNLDSEEATLKNVVKTQGKLKKGISQVDVEGKIFCDIQIGCIRCLISAESTLEIPFDVAFVVPENYTEAKEAELGVDDLEVSIIEDDRIDLTELVREQILLNLPTQIFCKEDCQGLCPKCGVNRNLIDCKCQEKEIDPRWEALGDLKF